MWERTDAIVKFKPQEIAAACIYLSSRMLKIALPDSWWILCDSSIHNIEEISLSIVNLYQIKSVKYISPDELDVLTKNKSKKKN